MKFSNNIIPDKVLIKETFKQFILVQDHPCVMAQSSMRSHSLEVQTVGDLNQSKTITEILAKLKSYIAEAKLNPGNFASLAISFATPAPPDEITYEKVLWKLLQDIHEADPKPWDKSVSSDAESEHFSFSIFGEAFYVVGMHPHSSRDARRFPYPVVVFNLHSQFEKLRNMKVYKKTRDRIRQRDRVKNGSVNPMLQDFGSGSEARQYSGREVDESWKCPFQVSKK